MGDIHNSSSGHPPIIRHNVEEMEDRAKRGEDISQLQVPLEAVKQTVTVPEDKDPRLMGQRQLWSNTGNGRE